MRSPPVCAVSYTYDAVGNRQTMHVIDDSAGGSTQDTFVQYFYDEQDRLRSEEQTTRIALNPSGWRDIAGRVPGERPLAAVAGFLGGVLLLLIAPLLIARGLLAVGWVAQRRRIRHGCLRLWIWPS